MLMSAIRIMITTALSWRPRWKGSAQVWYTGNKANRVWAPAREEETPRCRLSADLFMFRFFSPSLPRHRLHLPLMKCFVWTWTKPKVRAPAVEQEGSNTLWIRFMKSWYEFFLTRPGLASESGLLERMGFAAQPSHHLHAAIGGCRERDSKSGSRVKNGGC